MKLPVAFTDRMKVLLKDEFDDFIATYEKEPFKGIRINTLKTTVEEYLNISPFELKPISWIKEGFYIDEDEYRPGKHPHYHCGLYYIQEPSAMLPVEILNPQPGENVLDISAAPGGKTTQIGAKLKNKGIIVANDISPKRVRALVKNVELFGIKNCIVTNETPKNLSYKFSSFFDKILVDAPCSGEGMFRRDPKAIKGWSIYSSEQFCLMQRDILSSIPSMLKPGGCLVYSTCTFTPDENEGTIDWFLKEFPEFELEEIKNIEGIGRGRPEWLRARNDLSMTGRAWPHKINGEGHFIALLRKKDGSESKSTLFIKDKSNIEEYLSFESENLKISLEEDLTRVGSKLFMIPKGLPDIMGIKIASYGLYLGDISKERFEPSQAFAMALSFEDAANIIDFKSDSSEALKYLKGETLLIDGEKGWRLVCVDGYSVGWAKQMEGILKNQYNAEWRMK